MEGPTHNLDAVRKQQELLLNELSLIAGMPITLVKVAEENPDLPQAHILNGHLDSLGQFGQTLSVNQGESVTLPLTQIDVHNSRTYLQCGTSVYELMTSTINQSTSENVEKRKPKSVTTSKGSVYTYLPDGRTQRFKTVDGKMEEPQDLLVFIPPWNTLANKAKQMYPETFEGVGNETQFEQLLLQYAQLKGFVIIPVTSDGTKVQLLNELATNESLYLAFGVKNGDTQKIQFLLPVSKEPQLGWVTFDTRKFYDETDSILKREIHIGNKVVGIEYE